VADDTTSARPVLELGGSASTDRVVIAYLHPGGDVGHNFTASITDLYGIDARNGGPLTRAGHGPIRQRCGTGGLVEARNDAARWFLAETDAEWLLTIDSDMGFAPDAVEMLLDAAHESGRLIIGGLTFALRLEGSDGANGYAWEPFPVLYAWGQDHTGQVGFRNIFDYPPDTVIDVAGTGAAMLMIHRDALSAMPDPGHWYDPVRYASGVVLSEDLSFCTRAGAAGIPIAIHTGVRTNHAKTIWVNEALYLATRALAALTPPDDGGPA
jgi:glycosyltransferase involved in cell wall biosynthesis